MSFRASPFAALILLLALSTCVQAHPKDLFVPARKSAPIDGIDDGSAFYSWLSNTALLGDQYVSPGDREIVMVDLADKTVTRLDGLTKAFRPMDANPLADPRWVASPNGKWVLFYNFYPLGAELEPAKAGIPIQFQIAAVSIDGVRQISFTQNEAQSIVAWLADSRRWAEITDTEAIFHDLDNPSSATPIALSLTSVGAPSAFSPAGSTLLCVTSADHAILTSGWAGSRENPVTFCDLDLTANPVTGRIFSIPIPPSSQISAIAVSPDGRRIAWEWAVDGHQDDAAWWRAHDPQVRYTSDPDNLVELWTSDIDGSDFRLIGRADSGSATLLWSPDGKSLYFTFGNRFWGFAVK